MRRVFGIALLGTAFFVNQVAAQDSDETQSVRSKVESRPGHDLSLFEGGPPPKRGARHPIFDQPSVAEVPAVAAPVTPAPPTPAPVVPTVQPVAPGPPQKDLTGKEFTQIRVGAKAKEVLSILGPPSSRVVIPDDDGHLRETLQYWAKGVPMATVQLDNGRVVKIETQPK